MLDGHAEMMTASQHDSHRSWSIAPMHLSYSTIYCAFLVFLFLVPTFSGVLRAGGGLYLGEMLQVLYSGVFYLLLIAFMARQGVARFPLIVAIAFSSGFVVLIALAILRDSSRAVVSDLFEFYKPLYALVIVSATLLIRWDDRAVGRLVNAYLIIFALIGLYCLFEVAGGQTANQVSNLLYRSDKAVLVGKATGTLGITYLHASFMLFGALLAAALLLHLGKIRYLVIAALSLLAILFSQSRAAIIALATLVACVFLTYWAYRNFRHKGAFYLLFGAVVVTTYLALDRILPLFENLPYLYGGIELLLERGVEPDGQGSFSKRYQQILFAVESHDTIPLIGVGIGKGYARLLESYYALYLFRYGGVGIALSLAIFFAFYFLSLKAFNRAIGAGQRRNACFFIALHLWMYALPVLSLSGTIHDQGKFMVFFYGSLAVVTSYNREYLRGMPARFRGVRGRYRAAISAILRCGNYFRTG